MKNNKQKLVDFINKYYLAGNSDSGQEYIDIYRKLGFEVTKTVEVFGF